MTHEQTKLDAFMKGMRLIHAVAPDAGFDAQHDVIYVGGWEELSEDQRAVVLAFEHGWHFDRSVGCLGFFT